MDRFWRFVVWAGRIAAAHNIYKWAAAGGVVVAAGAAMTFLQNYPLWAGALGLLSALLLIVAATIYVLLPPPHSYFPRYRRWYLNPLRKISWRLGGVHLHGVSDGRAIIGEFCCSFRVNRGKVTPKRLVLEFEGRPKPLHVQIQVENQYRSCSEIDHIPSGSWIQCRARILKDENKSDDGVSNHPTIGEFNSLFGPFDLIFDADGYTFRRRFGRYELDMMIRGQDDIHHPPAPITPKLKDQRKSRRLIEDAAANEPAHPNLTLADLARSHLGITDFLAPDPNGQIGRFLRSVRESALHGRIQIWGRKDCDKEMEGLDIIPRTEISPDRWRNCQINEDVFMAQDGRAVTEQDGDKDWEYYADLHVCRLQAEKIWHAVNT